MTVFSFPNRVLAANLILALACPLILQSATTQIQVGHCGSKTNSTIRGLVSDSEKVGVANAKIIIENAELKCEVKTDECGRFFLRVPRGVYTLTVGANGFKRYIFNSLAISPHSVKKVDILMEIAVFSGSTVVPTPP